MHPQTLEPITVLFEAANEKRMCSLCGQPKGRDDYVSADDWKHCYRKCKACRDDEKARSELLGVVILRFFASSGNSLSIRQEAFSEPLGWAPQALRFFLSEPSPFEMFHDCLESRAV